MRHMTPTVSRRDWRADTTERKAGTMERLKDKVALVMGAGSAGPGWGNGKACAVQFAREGAAVVCFDLNRNAAEETAEIIRSDGGRSIAVGGDASNSEEVRQAVAACMAKFGRL